MTDAMIAEYKASGFGNLMGWGAKPVLLMVDVCKAYWTEGSPLSTLSHPPSAQAPEVMRRLVSAARSAGSPIIWTAVEYTHPEMRDAGLFWLKSKSLRAFNVGDDRGLGGWLGGQGLDALEPLDGSSPDDFDNGYFGNLLSRRGLLHSDQALFGGSGGATDGLVRAYASDAARWGSDFAAAMVRMASISPLTGADGEIRVNCRRVNN